MIQVSDLKRQNVMKKRTNATGIDLVGHVVYQQPQQNSAQNKSNNLLLAAAACFLLEEPASHAAVLGQALMF